MTGLSYVKLHHDSRSDLQAEASQLRAESPGDIGVEAWKKVLQPWKMVGFIFFFKDGTIKHLEFIVISWYLKGL